MLTKKKPVSKIIFRHVRRFQRRKPAHLTVLRNENGFYLVEVLIALSVGALMTYALLNTLSGSMRSLTSTQNQSAANAIMIELLEWTRVSGYEYLRSMPSENVITVNRTLANESGSDTGIRDDVAQLDDYNLDWSEIAEKGAFNGKIKYLISPASQPDSLKVTIRIAWVDSTSYGANSESILGAGREIFASTVVTKNGVGAYTK